MLYYSRQTGGFYDAGIHGTKGEEGSTVPADAVEISAADHAALLAEQEAGTRILAGPSGEPVALTPQATPEEVLAALRARRDRELAATDWTQLGDAALNEAQRKLWAEHRKALRDLPALVQAAIESGQDPAAVPYPPAPKIAPPTRGHAV